MAATHCRLHTVHVSPTVDIQHCPDCQMLHLTMGSITVRMSEQHFSQFAKDISKGLFEFNANIQPQLPARMLM